MVRSNINVHSKTEYSTYELCCDLLLNYVCVYVWNVYLYKVEYSKKFIIIIIILVLCPHTMPALAEPDMGFHASLSGTFA